MEKCVPFITKGSVPKHWMMKIDGKPANSGWPGETAVKMGFG